MQGPNVIFYCIGSVIQASWGNNESFAVFPAIAAKAPPSKKGRRFSAGGQLRDCRLDASARTVTRLARAIIIDCCPKGWVKRFPDMIPRP